MIMHTLCSCVTQGFSYNSVHGSVPHAHTLVFLMFIFVYTYSVCVIISVQFVCLISVFLSIRYIFLTKLPFDFSLFPSKVSS